MTLPLRLPALLSCLLVAACATEPTIQRPDDTVPVPAAWSQPTAAATTVKFPDARWWQAFGSAELARLVAQAEANNPDLAAAGYRIAQASAEARGARAALYPSIDGSGSGSRSVRGQGQPSSSLSLGLDVSYELDIWGENRANVDAAVASRIASEYDREAVALSLVAEVATAYFQYLSFSDRLATAEQVLDLSRQVLALIQTQARVGTASQLEVAQQQLTVANLESALPSLRQQRDQTLNALAALLGTTAGTLTLGAESLDEVVLPTVAAGLPSELLQRRPDLRSAEAQITAAGYTLEAAHAAMFPSVRLTSGAGLSSDALQALFQPAGFLANLAAGLTAPVFDAGRLAAQQDSAAAREAIAIESYRAAVLAAFRDVEDALAAIRYTAERAEIGERALTQARRAYNLAAIQYQAGTTDFISLLDAQRALAGQLDDQRQIRFDRLAATVDLFKSLGGGW
ncbi:MAG: efflux transporter outer membrane subunit [Alphaproteobacteria bacterium]